MTVFPRHILLLFCLLLGSQVLFAQTRSGNVQTIDGKKYYIHKIEKSQSLYAISKLYNTTVDNLYVLNPELKNGAKAGQEIRVPFTGPAGTAVEPVATTTVQVDTLRYVTHRVAKGETVYSITRKYNISEKQLNTFNPLLAQGLKEGQLLAVGEKTRRKSPAQPSSVVSKDKSITNTLKEPKPAPAVDSSLFKPVPKPKKENYNVALILPFRTAQTLDIDLAALIKTNAPFPAVPALAVDFYLGFKRAVDSLQAADFKVNIELFDMDDKDSAKLVQLANSARFKELDLIFGPLYANGFKTLAKKAKEFGIPIVSPLTTQNKILFNNQFISKTSPSQFTLLEGLADYCMDSLMAPGVNLILVNSERDKKELAFVVAFKKYYNDRQRALGKGMKDTVRVVKGVGALKSAFNTQGKNIVITFANNPAFAADFTTQLALFGNRDNCVLCSWEAMSENDNIDQEYLNQLNFTFPYQYNLVNSPAYARVIDDYRLQQDSYPGEYFFIGFDIALYYLNNLKSLGPDFVHSLGTLPAEGNYLRFKFARPDQSTGFDNRGMYIFRYANYQLHKTGWR